MQMQGSLVFSIRDIRESNGLACSYEMEPAAVAEFLAGMDLDGPLKVGLEFSVGGNRILLQGRLEGAWELPCSRCLAPCRCAFLNDLEEIYPLTQPLIDVREGIRQALVLTVPSKPLCKDSCLGLCSRCGGDLNAGPCGCEREKH